MIVNAVSYRGRTVLRKYVPHLLAAMPLALVLLVSGCAGTGLPFGDFDRTQTAAVASVQPTNASFQIIDAVEPSDWETIRQNIARMPSDSSTSGWSNAVTGSSGEIAILAAELSTPGAKCRAFATTINDIRGIRRYRGQACQRPGGTWQLSGIAPDDTQLL
jgi:hypothetical protein